MSATLETVPTAPTGARGGPRATGANPTADTLRALGPSGLDLRGADLRGQDLSGLDLSGGDLAHANLARAKLSFCRLREANLHGADLSDCELLGCDLSGADLTECKAERAGFGGAVLEGATFTTAHLAGATLSRARAAGARFAGAVLSGARLRECDLSDTDFTHADLAEADLQESRVDGACFIDADVQRANLRGVLGYTRATWLGADTRSANFRGALLMKRHIEDENYLHEFRTQSRTNALLYHLWWLTSDCGRSFTRWAAFTMILSVLFAVAYRFVAIDFGPNETIISPLYFSVVTLTTLGYGDALPVSSTAQLVVMAEVITGYVALGGLLSVFATKMARRAE